MSDGTAPVSRSPTTPSRRTRRLEESVIVDRALGAWRQLDPNALEPDGIEVLVRKKKSAVCRLAGPHGSVIAKRARRESGILEHCLHSEILPRLPLSSLRSHGVVEFGEDPAFCWLFMEDAGHAEISLDGAGDPPLLAAWLAALHASSIGLPEIDGLPDRGAAAGLLGLRSARGIILDSLTDPVHPEERAGLDPILAALDVLEAHWHEVEARCAALPRTLTHGDFVPKNMRTRTAGEGRELLVFDWEHSGGGPPGRDLGVLDLGCYGAALREYWTGIDAAWLRRVFETGRILRQVDEVGWAAKSLSLRGSEHSVAVLQLYARRLEARFRSEGWVRP